MTRRRKRIKDMCIREVKKGQQKFWGKKKKCEGVAGMI